MVAEVENRPPQVTAGNVPPIQKMASTDPPKKKKRKAREQEEKEERPIKFRNYTPRTPELKALCVPRQTTLELEETIDKTIEEHVKTAESDEMVLAIAPKKPNWDLKRDVEKKLNVLQGRTDRAVVQLIRRRITEDKGKLADVAKPSPDDEQGGQDEASMALAREVAKADATRAHFSDDEP